jgi:PD-(D/E)XK endonuclease
MSEQMFTGEKGKIAESKVLSELIKQGFRVSLPFGDYRYDLIVEYEGSCHRVQVKYVGAPTKRSTIPVILHSITRSGRHRYGVDEIDCVIVYYEPHESFFVIPATDLKGKTALNLRFQKARNRQQAGIVPASRYEGRWDLLKG